MFAFQKVFLLTLTMTYNKLMKYVFVSKDEIFIFLSLLEPSRSWLHQLTPLWTWWLTATRLQLVIVITFNLFSIICFQIVYDLCLSLLYYDLVNVTIFLISYIFYKIVVAILHCSMFNQASDKINDHQTFWYNW